MKRIIVTGATSMIGTALIEECIRHDIEVYAVVRAGSSKTKRLPESARIHQIECELEKLEELPAKITGECDTFFHIAWGNTGENRNSRAAEQKCLLYSEGCPCCSCNGMQKIYRSRFTGRIWTDGCSADRTGQSGTSDDALRCEQARCKPAFFHAL